MTTEITLRGECVTVTCTDKTCTVTPTQIGRAYAARLVAEDDADVDRVEDDDYLDRIMEDVAVECLWATVVWATDDPCDRVSVGGQVYRVESRSNALRQLAQGIPVAWSAQR